MKKYRVKCKKCGEVNTVLAENKQIVIKCYGCPCGSHYFEVN